MNILREIAEHWVKDWRDNRWLFWIELFGCLLNGTSTTLINLYATHPPMLLCTCLWLIGTSLIMVSCYIRRAIWMQMLMAYYTIMNIVGLVNLVLR